MPASPALGLLLLSFAAGSANAAEITDLSPDLDYFANSWGVVGLKDYPGACRITPDWRLQLADGIEAVWLFGRDATPLPRGIRRTLPRGLPLPASRVLVDGAVECQVSAFAAPLPGLPYDYLKRSADEDNFAVGAWVLVRNVTDRPQSARVALRLQRDGAPLHLAASSGDAVEGGRARACFRSPDGRAEIIRDDGTLAAAWDLAPSAYGHVYFWLPYRALDPEGAAFRSLRERSPGRAYLDTADYWRRLLRLDPPRLIIPEAKVRDTYFASLAYQFIGRDDGHVHAGEGFYDGFFLRDGAYQVWSLEAAGYLDEARPSALDFLNYQKPTGQFESQGGELDGNGQALWNLVRHYAYTRDQAYLRQVYPAIRRSMDWLEPSLQRAPDDPDAAFAGVLPRSWADGEALGKSDYHIVGYDFWNLRGALCATYAATALNETQDADHWRRLADSYRADLVRLVEASGARGFPPSLEGEGTDWGNLEVIYPTRLFAPTDPRVSATLANARRTFVEGTIRWCPQTQQTIHPYMSTFLTNSYLIRGEYDPAVRGLYAMLLHSTSDHGFPEGVYYSSRTAWGDTVPHLWAAAQYCLLLRNMLVREDEADLHLASAVPTHWLAPGREVAFRSAPTTFGPAGFRLQAEAGVLRAWIDSPTSPELREVILHTPPSIVTTNVHARAGHVRRFTQHQIALAPGNAYLEIGITRRPYDVCDYRTTVASYLRGHRARPPQLNAVLTWPLAEPLRPDRCVSLDLRQAANVDPFTAPFGTLNPGKYLFTGLQTGRLTVAGLPFEIIDPASNEGRAFVVLQGLNTSANFPRMVEIPAGVPGSRAFFLGQVTGWAPGDPGDPKTHSVGEYVLEYADGKRQTVPLVSRLTVDDWAMAPTASLTQVGLQGDPWHLSVLAVRLRPLKLARIIFRDAGTPASPLLAAVTIEQ